MREFSNETVEKYVESVIKSAVKAMNFKQINRVFNSTAFACEIITHCRRKDKDSSQFLRRVFLYAKLSLKKGRKCVRNIKCIKLKNGAKLYLHRESVKEISKG